MTEKIIKGYTITVIAKDREEFPELTPMWEESARAVLRAQGVEPIHEEWMFEDAVEWWDEVLQETLILPARWMFMVEGVQP